MYKAIYKVPNGKLLKIFVEEKDGCIEVLKITGDFFAYPEENIEMLEEALRGQKLVPEELRTALADFLKKSPTRFFGLDEESLIATILAAR